MMWLLFYVVGRLAQSRPVDARRYVVGVVSVALLFGAVGATAAALYVVSGLVVICVGLWLKGAAETWLRRAVFAAAVAAVVLGLVGFLAWRQYFYKYCPYLPSLSYLGFRGVAYLVSCYRHREVSLSSGLVQMFFFPAVFTGPISRVENFEEVTQDYREVLRRMAMGFSMLVAGRLAGTYVLVDVVNLSGLACWRYWVGIPANALELYFTFAGYTHLVIGLGLLAGFRLPENFSHPYLSSSFREFWRRWHMSLSFWIRDYVYIPLGGSRRGPARKCLNLMVAMVVFGLWHGLSLHFLIWGAVHGLLLSAESVTAHLGWRPMQRVFGKASGVVKTAFTFCVVSFLWLLFRYSVTEFVAYMKGLASW